MARLTVVPPSPPPLLPALDELLQQDEGAYVGVHMGTSHWAIVGEFQPDDYIHEIAGDVAVFGSGGDILGKLGEFVVKLVDVDSAIADHESVFDVFDQSDSTIGYFDLYEPGGWQFRESVLRVVGCEDESVPCGLLIIDRLELAPPYRGKGVGLKAMECLIGRFRMGAGLVAIKPFPLQFEGAVSDEPDMLRRRGFDRYPASEAACVRRLVRHYAQIGFERVPRSPYMCLPLIRGFRPLPEAN
jgi:GNAT superfamily N-acetyltransferase